MPKNYNTQNFPDFLQNSFNPFSDDNGLNSLGLLDSIWNDVTGVTEQQLEFEQQEYLMDKQNEYDLLTNQVQRVLDAGLNPNTMFGAQSSNVSASPSQVATQGSGTSSGLANAASALSSVGLLGSQKAVNFGSAAKFFAESETEDLLRPERLNQIKAAWQVDDYKAQILAEQLPYVEQETIAKIQNLEAQKDLFNANRDLFLKQVDEIEKQMKLLDKELDIKEQIFLQEQMNTAILEWRKTCVDLFKFDPVNGVENSVFAIGMQSGIGSDNWNSATENLYHIYYQKEGRIQKDIISHKFDSWLNHQMQFMQVQIAEQIRQKYKELPAELIKGLEDIIGNVLSLKFLKSKPNGYGNTYYPPNSTFTYD